MQLRENRNIVFVVDGNSVSERAVRLGPKVGEKRNVIEGLAAGDEVVVSVAEGTFADLNDGALVAVQ